MISGTKAAASAAVLLLAALALSAAAAQPIDLPGLMRLLASVQSARASFVETRTSPLLKAPLVSRGTLAYKRPGLLAQHVQSPRDERFVLQGDRLTVENASGKRSLTLPPDGGGGIGALIGGLRAVRAGDLAALERGFALHVDGTRAHWQLRLLPREPGLAKYVRQITLAGSAARIERIVVQEASGDRTVMDIRETVH